MERKHDKQGFFAFLFEQISKMTGGWPSISKVILMALFAWVVWQTTETFANKYNRERTINIEQSLTELTTSFDNFKVIMEQKLATLPPQDWRDRIVQLEAFNSRFSPPEIAARLAILEAEQKLIRAQLLGSETKNNKDHTEILVSLEFIKTTLSEKNDK